MLYLEFPITSYHCIQPLSVHESVSRKIPKSQERSPWSKNTFTLLLQDCTNTSSNLYSILEASEENTLPITLNIVSSQQRGV